MAQINTRIILRNDSSANWLAHENVTLLKGEVGIEFLSNGSCKVKIGDGVRTWKELDYFGGEQLVGDDKTISVNGQTISLQGFEEAAAGAQPRKNANGEIEWVVPSTETVDGLQSAISGLESDVSSLRELVNETDSKIADAVNTLLEQVTDNDKVDTIKELFDFVDEHGSDFTTVLEKLNTIEEGAQVNTIEGLSLNGDNLNISNKIIDIPVAKLDKLGVVKSATGANKVNVAADGTMSVNRVDVNSIVVPVGEEVVLNGGNSAGAAMAYAVSIDNYGYANLADAIAHAGNGDVITLQDNLQSAQSVKVSADNVTINLNGHNIIANGSDGAVLVENGMAVLEGSGLVHGTLGTDKYSMGVWAHDGHVVINDGLYTNETDGSERGTDLIYASGNAVIEINGGVFEAATPAWTLNVKDSDYEAGKANIIVRGGSFKNFDPANCAAGAEKNFVALGYQSIKEGDYYVVKPL